MQSIIYYFLYINSWPDAMTLLTGKSGLLAVEYVQIYIQRIKISGSFVETCGVNVFRASNFQYRKIWRIASKICRRNYELIFHTKPSTSFDRVAKYHKEKHIPLWTTSTVGSAHPGRRNGRVNKPVVPTRGRAEASYMIVFLKVIK